MSTSPDSPAGESRRMTKQALAIVSHTLEKTAEALGPSATVIGTFQQQTYFEAQARSFRRLGDHGVTTVAAYAGDRTSPAAHHVVLDPDDPLTRIWAAVLVSDSLCGFVHAVDIDEYGDTTDGLEPARLFDAEIGFDAGRTREVADELIAELVRAGLDPRFALPARTAPRRSTPDAATAGWAAGMQVLANRLANVSEAWRREQTHATRDPLTGLSNREGLRRWSGSTEDSTLPNAPVGVLVFDMNGFKQINDRFGHEAGDTMLQRVGDVLSNHCRRGDLAVRSGGDEFVMLCPGIRDEEQLAGIGRRIAEEIATIEVGGVHASVAYGADVCVRRPIVLATADAAMYRAKHSAPA